VLAVVSKRWSVPVTVFDLVKGMIVVFVAKMIGLEAYQQVTVGIAAIAGHNWPIFLRFSGGRGALTTIGVVVALTPWLGLTLTAVAFLFSPFRQLAFGTLVAMAALPLCSWLLSQPFCIEERNQLTFGFLIIFLIAVFRRLTAPRSPFTASLPTGELMINRLLFDRDIRDRKAWISQAPSEISPTEKPSKPEQS
jgi:glycerol-3-phosphate acyltransferase PlsY